MTRDVLISVEGKTLGISKQRKTMGKLDFQTTWLAYNKEQRVEAEGKLKRDRVWVYTLVISIKTETENRLWNTFYAKPNTTFVQSPEARLSPSGPLHQGGMLPLPANPTLQARSPSQSSKPPTTPSRASLSNCDLDSCFREKTEAVESNLSSIPSTYPHLCLSSARCKQWAIAA